MGEFSAGSWTGTRDEVQTADYPTHAAGHGHHKGRRVLTSGQNALNEDESNNDEQ